MCVCVCVCLSVSLHECVLVCRAHTRTTPAPLNVVQFYIRNLLNPTPSRKLASVGFVRSNLSGVVYGSLKCFSSLWPPAPGKGRERFYRDDVPGDIVDIYFHAVLLW